MVFKSWLTAAKHREPVATVFDGSNHDNGGSFLEAIQLLAEYNTQLQEHLQNIIFKKKKDPSKKGCGKFVSFLSKTTATKITNIISDMFKNKNVNEVKDAGLFSV